ncbi:hypothetical protein TeGR_g11781, partial [Tetraparma gracilis]
PPPPPPPPPSSEPEKYFVPGGFALTHDDSTTSITCPDAVKLDDLDPAAVSSNFSLAKKEFDNAEAGSEAAALAQIDMDVCRAMAAATGATVSA